MLSLQVVKMKRCSTTKGSLELHAWGAREAVILGQEMVLLLRSLKATLPARPFGSVIKIAVFFK